MTFNLILFTSNFPKKSFRKDQKRTIKKYRFFSAVKNQFVSIKNGQKNKFSTRTKWSYLQGKVNQTLMVTSFRN